ncbi:MAG: prevent-host-death protein [Acidimicrobiaceae bacterium]|nr:hypothetical protein [Acidimicrobiaceae bacterium]MXW94950.1 prevent-host-death protein [Acidimicrobiaceae bacterium]MYE98284.1 prevent-host-death protein [Acidimicrobiaceae bacterium]MYI54667.1 prevent-host-death protein [Acidimicrobiaceae bacterium]
MMQYLSYTDTRSHLREVLDTAEAGLPIGIRRHDTLVSLVESGRLREILMDSRRLRRPEAVVEAGGWSVFLPGTPVAADGADLAEAVDEFVAALREYAEDWQARLRFAPNHQQHWPLVQLVSLASDADLAEWTRGSGP